MSGLEKVKGDLDAYIANANTPDLTADSFQGSEVWICIVMWLAITFNCEIKKMVRQHHRLKGNETEQTLEDSEGQRSLASCSPWGHKESDITQ